MITKPLDLVDNSKIIIFTDLHAHEYKKFNLPTSNGFGTRLKWILHTLDTIITYAISNKIKHIFFLGDLLHHRTLLYSIVFDKISEHLAFGIDKGIEFHFILGNHDYIYNTDDSPSIITRLQSIDIISEPTIYTLPTDYGYNIGCTPFRFDVTTQEQDIRDLSAYCEHSENVLLGHLELSGAHVNDEYVLAGSLQNELFNCLNFNFVFTGHVHSRQIIIVHRPNYPLSPVKIEYVGIPIQHTFNEENKDYGFTVYDCMLRDPTYIKLSELTTVPEFNTVDFYTQDDISEFLNTCNLLNYYRFRGHDPELYVDKLFKTIEFYSYDCVGASLPSNSEEDTTKQSYKFNLDFQHYLLLFMQELEKSGDYSWFEMAEAEKYLEEIYKQGNLCLK
jgi:hypothetical protein